MRQVRGKSITAMTWWRFYFLIIPTAGAAVIAAFIHTEARWIYPTIVGFGIGYIVNQFAHGIRAVRRARERCPITETESEAAYDELRGIIARLDESKTPSVETGAFLLDTRGMEQQATNSQANSARTTAPKPSPYAAVPAAPAVPLTRN